MGANENKQRMQIQTYTAPAWQNGHVSPDLWELLSGEDRLLEITSGAPPYRVVLGVPHHAAPGVECIAERVRFDGKKKNGRAADENSGLSGLALLAALADRGVPARLVIAVHATDHDPNKEPGSPYWQRVFSEPLPALLFELHGAGQRRTHDLELSAGKNRHARPLDFGRRLLHYLADPNISLAVQAKPGHALGWVLKDGTEQEGKLDNPALGTGSLEYASQLGFAALHLEMKPLFRRLDTQGSLTPRPSDSGLELARALAETLDEALPDL